MDLKTLAKYANTAPFPREIEVTQAEYDAVVAETPPQFRFTKNDGTVNLYTLSGITLRVKAEG